ncbi:hypothetical protein JCM10207_002592 [Rhodosporidiobolus poonsookiae]
MHAIQLAALFCLLGAALATPAPPYAIGRHRWARRDDVAGLQSGSRISQGQVDGIEGLLNRTADRSWEIGTHLEALLEFHYPSMSPFSSSSSDWTSISPSTSPSPDLVLSIVASVLSDQPSGQAQLVQDGSAADPASIAPFVVLANYTLDEDASLAGKSKEEVQQAVERQLEAVLSQTPRTGDGAISHRVEDVELWSDFVYMVPPFLAYLGVQTSNTTLLRAAYDQVRLYRQYLAVTESGETQGLWRHIWEESGNGDADAGLWATGNAWAASGMLRVLASLQNSDYADEFASQSGDLASWTGAIVERVWAMPESNGLSYNYLNDTSTFADAASTALHVASTYRLAQLCARFSSLSSSAPSSTALSQAESAYLTLTGSTHLTSAGVLKPVVNPMSYGDQLSNVRDDGSGSVSPEGEAFVLLMEAARRDFTQNGGTRDTLTQLHAITARSEGEEAASVEVLREVGWNLEAAIAQIYDAAPSSSSSAARHAYPPSAAPADDAGVDDALLPSTSHAATPRRRANGTHGLGTGAVGIYYLKQVLAVPVAILAWPARLLYNLGAVLLTFLARLLRLRPSTASFRPRNPFTAPRRPRTILAPAAAAEAWIRSVEAASGLSCASLSGPEGGSSGVQVGSSAAGVARRTAAAAVGGGDERRLPEFFVGGYEQALRKARDEIRVLMVVLSCAEHEMDEAFKRDVLPNPELVKALAEENVLVWGGDVGERDGYQVGQTLSYVSLPFLAFISLQPSSPTSSNPSTAPLTAPRMRLLTRLEPSSSAPLTAAAIHTHLTTAVLPRAQPFLARLVADKLQRERDRRAREAAEQRAASRMKEDEARVLAVRQREAERRRAEAAQREAEEQRAAEEAVRALEAGRARRWRAQKRKELERRGEPGQGEGVRCVVRLGDGRRVMRSFAGGEGTQEVYAWVECALAEREDALAGAGEDEAVGDDEAYTQRFAFRLATAYPRWVVPLPRSLDATLSASAAGGDEEEEVSVAEAFAGQGGTVNLVVDGLEERRRMSMSSRGEESEDEEEEEEEE